MTDRAELAERLRHEALSVEGGYETGIDAPKLFRAAADALDAAARPEPDGWICEVRVFEGRDDWSAVSRRGLDDTLWPRDEAEAWRLKNVSPDTRIRPVYFGRPVVEQAPVDPQDEQCANCNRTRREHQRGYASPTCRFRPMPSTSEALASCGAQKCHDGHDLTCVRPSGAEHGDRHVAYREMKRVTWPASEAPAIRKCADCGEVPPAWNCPTPKSCAAIAYSTTSEAPAVEAEKECAHRWHLTGMERMSNPPEYERKCADCGAREWIPEGQAEITYGSAAVLAATAQPDAPVQERATLDDFKRAVTEINLTSTDYVMRDSFACAALSGWCANPAVFASNGSNGWALVNCSDADLAGYAYHIADAMMAARTPIPGTRAATQTESEAHNG